MQREKLVFKNYLKRFYQFSNTHKVGVLILIFLILLIQLVFFFIKNTSFNNVETISNEERAWLNQEIPSESAFNFTAKKKRRQIIYPFNPNFISDSKGYYLGLTPVQIDKLHNFRKEGKFVNSVEEFAILTGVSKSWINKYQNYFKFPDWVKNRNSKKQNTYFDKSKKVYKQQKQDINTANQEQLEKVYYIGENLAKKIIDQRSQLGGFVDMEQLSFIWGISQEALKDVNDKFEVQTKNLIKIDINNASMSELAKHPYIGYKVAKQIVTYRSMNGDFKNEADLTKIKDLSVEKIKYLTVYLNF